MFQKIVINLDGPICSCEEMALTWTVGKALDPKPDGTMSEGSYLQVSCKTCKTKLHVPHEKFVASFELKRGYPGKKSEPVKPKLEILAGGKVIPFVNPEGEGNADSKDN